MANRPSTWKTLPGGGTYERPTTKSRFLGHLASGIDYVPSDGFAFLHQGEKVTPASENRLGMPRVTSGGGSTTINISAPFHVDKISSDVELKRAFEAHRREIARLIPRLAVNAVKNDLAQRRG